MLGAPLGSVSQYLAGHAPCPVVVVKPSAHPGHRHHER
jgi:nucleotide-binding universal stress UspA family protein